MRHLRIVNLMSIICWLYLAPKLAYDLMESGVGEQLFDLFGIVSTVFLNSWLQTLSASKVEIGKVVRAKIMLVSVSFASPLFALGIMQAYSKGPSWILNVPSALLVCASLTWRLWKSESR